MSTAATKHVLVIEPDMAQRLAIADVLTDASIILHFATSAQSAVAAADTNAPGVVILELALPGHNGIEFLHEFRSYPEWTTVPLIIFSQQLIEDKAVFKNLGNIIYLYKPTTSLATLKKQLVSLLA